VGDRTRTGDIQIHSLPESGPNSVPDKRSEHGGAPLTGPLTGTAANACDSVRATDPELARVVEAWPHLPAHIQAAVLALVKSVALTSSK
jgi:hypothetical protein